MRPIPGQCRFCHCTESNACSTPPCGEPCAWVDRNRTVCSNPSCLRAWGELKRRLEYEARKRNRKKTPAEIHALIVGKQKRGRSRQRKLKGVKPGSGDAA